MTTRRTWLWTVPALLLLAFLMLRIVATTHLYSDETLVYESTGYDYVTTMSYLPTKDVHPPLWLSIFWLWRHLVGDNEFAGRIHAFLFSLLTLAMTYRIGRDWFGRARHGWFALALLGTNAFFLTYAFDIRPYALVMLVAAVSMWVFERWLRRGTRRLALAYAAVTALLFYLHYFLVFLVVAQVIYFLLRRPSRRLIVQAAGIPLLILALCAPWLPSFAAQVGHLRELAQEAGNTYGLGVGTPATTNATNVETILRLAQVATGGQPLFYGLLLAFGAALLWRRAQYRLALIWVLGVPAVALLLNTVAAVYNERYVVYLAVGLALAVGAALAALRRVVARDLVLIGVVALNLWLLPAQLPVRVPYRDLYRSMDSRPGDVAYFADPIDQFLDWQNQTYLPPVLKIVKDSDLDAASTARRVWFMTGNWFDPQVHAWFEQLEPTHPVQQVLGQCDRAWCYLVQLMEAPPLATPQRFGATMDFWGADVDSVSRDAISARLWWRVEQTPDADYSISLRLVDSAGALAAQKDGPIQHYGIETVQTSQLQPGKIYIDWRALDTSIPVGTYRLELVVYQSWDNTRLLLPDGSDALTLETLTIS